MHDVHPDRAPSVPEPHRPHILRRIMAVASGLASLGLIFGLWNARMGIADDWEAGFGWIYIFQGLLVVAFGAGAAVLWYPKGQRGIPRKILIGTVTLLIVGIGVLFYFAAA